MKPRICSSPAVAAVVALTSLAAAAGGAGAMATSSVRGGGSGPLDSDRVDVQVTARGAEAAASGWFNIVHHTPDGIFAHLAGQIDCVALTGSTAVLTGTITEGFDGLGVDPVGERVSLVIHDNDVDTVELDVSFVSGHAIPPCSAEPILAVVIDRGQFKVRP